MSKTREKLKHLVVIGAGGNIGSHLLPHLARMPEVGKLTLIDPDRYEASNVGTQNITPGDVGQRKVSAQARKLTQINPALAIESLALPVVDVPLGWLRSDLLLACLDSRRARMEVNRIASRLGVPWIDAGVEPGGWLARINAYASRPGGPCLECSWDDGDYRLLEQRYHCSPDKQSAFPSNAPSSLGGLAASLQALEVNKILAGEDETALFGRQVLVDARNQRHFLTTMTARSDCRNRPHESWRIKASKLTAQGSTLDDAFDSWRTNGRKVMEELTDKESISLLVDPHRFCRRVYCSGCGRAQTRWRLLRANNPRDLRCPRCRRGLLSVGRDLVPHLTASLLSPRDLNRSLYSFGLRDGDVLTLRSQTFEEHFEVSGTR